MKWQVGCSGFHYKEWQGIFYPNELAQQKWFEHYCTQFNTLELNVTFYRFPQPGFLQSWYQRSPEGFCFSVKAPRLITHYKQLKETETELTDFYKTIKNGLREKLGPVLFQFPPKFHYTDENLQRIIDSMDAAFTNVVEFRHSSWWHGEVYTQLAKNNIIFSGISYPGLPEKIVHNTSSIYYRFHGVPNLYSSAYRQTDLLNMVTELLTIGHLKTVYIYFNNTANAAAVRNAQWLHEYVIGLNRIVPDGIVFEFN